MNFDFEISEVHCICYITTPVISNYWYLKVNFLGSENLLLDICSLRQENLDRYVSSLRLILTLRYQRFTVYVTSQLL